MAEQKNSTSLSKAEEAKDHRQTRPKECIRSGVVNQSTKNVLQNRT